MILPMKHDVNNYYRRLIHPNRAIDCIRMKDANSIDKVIFSSIFHSFTEIYVRRLCVADQDIEDANQFASLS